MDQTIYSIWMYMSDWELIKISDELVLPTSFAYANNRYIISYETLPKQSNMFDQFIVSDDGLNWRYENLEPLLDYAINDIQLCGNGSKFVLAGTKIVEDKKSLVIFESIDGIKWKSVYERNMISENNVPKRIKYIGGNYFIVCKNSFVMGFDNNWKEYKLPQEANNNIIIDIVFKDSKFYILVTDEKNYKIVICDNTMKFIMLKNYVEYSNHSNYTKLVKPYALGTDGMKIVVVGCNNQNNVSITYSFSDDNWQTYTIHNTIALDYDNCESTLYDVIYSNGEWILVGSIEQLINGMRIPLRGLCYRFQEDLTMTTPFLTDFVPINSLSRVYSTGDNLYAHTGVSNTGNYICKL